MHAGADRVGRPSYDLVHFANKIPDVAHIASLGSQEKILHPDSGTGPLFESKFWLWGLMAVMIIGLGFFTVKMMKQKSAAG